MESEVLEKMWRNISGQAAGELFQFCSDEGLALETSAIVSLTASITPINTQLIHQFVFHRADAVT